MVVVLTLIIAVVNVCLGVVLAVKFGFGPPTLTDAWETLVAGPQPGLSEQEVAAVELEAMLHETEQADLSAMFEEDTLEDLFSEAFEENDAETQAFQAAQEENTVEEGQTEGPEIWDLNEKYVETSILRLNIAMMKSGARATEIDTRLRSMRGRSDAETIQACLKSLKEDCETYLKQQSEAAEKFHNRLGELGELAALGEEIEMANMEQAAQIETTINNLTNMDFTSDLELANTQLLAELAHLRTARHRLRDSQEDAFLAVARYEGRIEKIEPQLYNDALTMMTNRIGLETILQQWWKIGHQRNRQLSMALFDLDAFGVINEEHGLLVADKILVQVARLVEKEANTGDLVARFAGERFFFMTVDIGPRAAIKRFELLRQKLERITFVANEQEIHVTLGCAMTEVKPDDPVEALFERLETALRAAKQAGPNRSFLHDGREIQPIESPNLGADYIEIKI